MLKVALSLDGKIACTDGTSQWITGADARADVHALRARSQAILVGSGTALADKPRLTARPPRLPVGMLPPAAPLLRVLLDARGSVTSGPLLDSATAPTLVFTTADAAPEALAAWRSAGIDVVVVTKGVSGGVRLEEVLDELGRRGVLQLLVEGGAAVHTSFLREGLVDELHVYKGSTVIGEGGRSWITSSLAATIGDARFWALRSVRQAGNDAVMIYGKPDNGLAVTTTAAATASSDLDTPIAMSTL